MLSLVSDQPFGVPLSLPQMVPPTGTDKVVIWITKWLFGKTWCNEEKGISETLTATGQSGLAATRLLGRSGASLQDSSDDEELEIAMRPQASWEWLAEDQTPR